MPFTPYISRDQEGEKGREENWAGIPIGQVIDKYGSGFRHGGYGVFFYSGVGGEDAFCEALDHCFGEGKVLGHIVSLELGGILEKGCVLRR